MASLPTTTPTPSRKRRAPGEDNQDQTEEQHIYYDQSPQAASSKRQQNPYGNPITRQTLVYNTHPLLNSLAISRLFVTANFAVYDPASSCVLLCIMREEDTQYRALCRILQGLYQHAPTLQALAIVPEDQVETSYWQALQKTLPIARSGDLNEAAADDLKAFLVKLDVSADVAVLIESSGRCIWTSDDLEPHEKAEPVILSRALERMLSPPSEDANEGAMDLG